MEAALIPALNKMAKKHKRDPKSKENINQQSTLKTIHIRALILFKILALYKSFTSLFTVCSYVYAYHRVQLLYTIQHRSDCFLIIFPVIHRTNIIAQTLSTGGEVLL